MKTGDQCTTLQCDSFYVQLRLMHKVYNSIFTSIIPTFEPKQKNYLKLMKSVLAYMDKLENMHPNKESINQSTTTNHTITKHQHYQHTSSNKMQKWNQIIPITQDKTTLAEVHSPVTRTSRSASPAACVLTRNDEYLLTATCDKSPWTVTRLASNIGTVMGHAGNQTGI